jgi:hypothetical protein
MGWRAVVRVLVTGVVLAGAAQLVRPDDPSTTAQPSDAAETESAWPGPATTGATTDEAELTPSDHCRIETDEVVEGVLLDCPDGLTLGGGATLRDAVVRSDGEFGIRTAEPGMPAVVEDVTITRTSACVPGVALGSAGYVAKRVTVNGFSGGFLVTGDHVEVHDSYAKLCSADGAAINGFVGYYAGDDVVFSHNTLDGRCPAEELCLTDALVAWGESGDRLVLADNLFRGGGYTLRIGSGTGHTVRGNLVERGSYVFGPVHVCTGVTTWTDNVEAALDAAAVPRHEEPLLCESQRG